MPVKTEQLADIATDKAPVEQPAVHVAAATPANQEASPEVLRQKLNEITNSEKQEQDNGGKAIFMEGFSPVEQLLTLLNLALYMFGV